MSRLISLWSEASSRKGSQRTSVAMGTSLAWCQPVYWAIIKPEHLSVKSLACIDSAGGVAAPRQRSDSVLPVRHGGVDRRERARLALGAGGPGGLGARLPRRLLPVHEQEV